MFKKMILIFGEMFPSKPLVELTTGKKGMFPQKSVLVKHVSPD